MVIIIIFPANIDTNLLCYSGTEQIIHVSITNEVIAKAYGGRIFYEIGKNVLNTIKPETNFE
jgi:hypothetical protein